MMIVSLTVMKPEQDVDEKIFAKISKVDIDENVQRRCNTLVSYGLGDNPYYGYLKACLSRL